MKKKFALSESQLAYLLVLPTVAIILGITFYPILKAFTLSLHSIQLQFPQFGQPFVGLENYLETLKSVRFWNAMKNTVTFTFASVSLELVLGLGLALLINMSFKGRGLVRASILIPWAFTTVVAALMWQFMYNDQYGVINYILTKLNLVSGSANWLGSPSLAMTSMIIADVWKTTPFMALLLLAGLQTIPADLYEAGRIDGTNSWQSFLHITLPLLKPTILVALLFRTLDAFRMFDLVFVLTNGGPGNSTETISLLTYNTLFREFDFGTGSALSVITFLSIFLISYVYIKVLGAKPNE